MTQARTLSCPVPAASRGPGMDIVWFVYRGLFADNPRAIYEALVARRGSADRHRWICTAKTRDSLPPGIEPILFGTPEAVAALESADLVVGNDCISMEWTKRPGATYLQTWHGTPLKRIHHDIPNAPEGWLTKPDRDVARWDFLLSPNPPSTELLRKAFQFDGPMPETGYPRNDVLSRPDRDEVRARVRAQLGIADGTTAVLYAPTWRDDLVLTNAGTPQVQLPLDLDDFAARLGSDHVLLLRLHNIISDRLELQPGSPIIDVSDRPESGELYLAADVLVTDYSSAMFDFAITGKPMLFFTYDLEHYRDDLRGFYVDLPEIAPGPLLRTSDELVAAISDIDGVVADHAGSYARFRETFCALEDGHATERVLDLLLASVDSSRTRHPGKGMNVRTYDRALTSSPRDLARTAAPRPRHSRVQVVILAAGMGTRLGRALPKPLTQLGDGHTILSRQLEGLRTALGEDVSITAVVGYRGKRIMRAAPELLFAFNPDYETTNTSKSLLRALRTSGAGGVLWLNGDVVFDPAVLEYVLAWVRADESFVCVDTSTVADEEVKYTLDEEGYIRELSKTVVGGLGEAVGINYVSSSDKAVLIEHLASCEDQDYFERGIETAITLDGLRFRPLDISAFSAVEVDFESDLERANMLFRAPSSDLSLAAEVS